MLFEVELFKCQAAYFDEKSDPSKFTTERNTFTTGYLPNWQTQMVGYQKTAGLPLFRAQPNSDKLLVAVDDHALDLLRITGRAAGWPGGRAHF